MACRSLLVRTLGVALLTLGLTGEVWAAWYFSWRCPGCARIGAATSGTPGPFSSQSACESARSSMAAQMRSQGGGVSIGSCYQRGGSGGGAPMMGGSTGDPVIDAMMPGLQQGAYALGQELGKMLFGDPAEAERRRRQQELEAKRAAEAARRRAEEEARHKEQQYQELMSTMLPVPGMETSSAAAPDGGAPPQANDIRRTGAFEKGLRDGSQCYPSNAFGYCLTVDPPQQPNCTEVYEAGYREGDQHRQRLMQDAYRSGYDAGTAGRKNDGFNDPAASGGCRNEWVRTYNSGYFQGKATRTAR